MSGNENRLVPYSSQPREVVLRHGNAIVLFDELSQTIEVEPDAESLDQPLNICPACRRPFDTEHEFEENNTAYRDSSQAAFITHDYFRLLQQSRAPSEAPSRSVSPQLRLALTDGPSQPSTRSSTQTATPPRSTRSKSQKIAAESFSQGYFKTFFIEERELGRGGNGVVLLVKHVINGVNLGQFACKRIPVGDDSEWLKKVLLEVQLLQNLSHKNVVKYNHVWLENMQISKFGPEVPCAFILQQYCNAGDLQNYLFGQAETMTKEKLKARARRHSRGEGAEPSNGRMHRHMAFEEIFSFFRDITSGLHYLHSNGYVHRDLKPGNCLLHRTGSQVRVLVSDFGEMQDVKIKRKSSGNTGTISYCAPEVLAKDNFGHFGEFSPKSDVFSLGLIVHLMCFGRLPFLAANVVAEEDEDIEQLRAEISTWSGLDLEHRGRTDLPDKLYTFLKMLLATNPSDRPTTDEILQGIKIGSMSQDFDYSSNATSPRKDSGWSFSAATTSAEPTPTTLEMRRRPSALVHQRSSEKTLFALRSVSQQRSVDDASATSSRSSTSPLASSSATVRPRLQTSYSTARLLPPPAPRPRTVSARIRHFMMQPADPWIRATLFCIKVGSTFHHCSPLGTSLWATYPLLVLALWDVLGWRGKLHSTMISLVLLFAHASLVTVALDRGFLCQKVVIVEQGMKLMEGVTIYLLVLANPSANTD